uniref:Gag protein n=1 Tax=Macrostomum lignano TaxID=282301 RepID=A0A1I8HIB1_9PLAT
TWRARAIDDDVDYESNQQNFDHNDSRVTEVSFISEKPASNARECAGPPPRPTLATLAASAKLLSRFGSQPKAITVEDINLLPES